jgi:glucan phosphoethanolaminetransferase (alkaline phosphatase superfamily)
LDQEFPSLLLVPLDLLDPTVVLLPLLTRIVLSVLLLKSIATTRSAFMAWTRSICDLG